MDEISRLAGACAVLSAAYLAAFVAARAGAARRRPMLRADAPSAGRLARWLGSAGVVLAVVSPAAATAGKHADRDAARTGRAASPPWDADLRRPARGPTEDAAPSRLPWADVRAVQLQAGDGHAGRASQRSAPPWSGDDGSSPPRPSRRTGAAAAEPRPDIAAGSPPHLAEGKPSQGEWTVERGDTLWDIAARVLGTTHGTRITGYWQSIFRANRDVIGANPNLILPGQVLELPPQE